MGVKNHPPGTLPSTTVGLPPEVARISTFWFWSVSGDQHIDSGMVVLTSSVKHTNTILRAPYRDVASVDQTHSLIISKTCQGNDVRERDRQ